VERAPDIIFRYRMRPRRQYEYVNEASTRICGYTPAEHYADPDLRLKIVHPDDRPLLVEAMLDRVGTPYLLRFLQKGGGLVWLEERTVPVYDEAGELVAIEGFEREIPDPTVEEDARVRVLGPVRIDLVERRVLVDGREAQLTSAEFSLLVLLTDQPGRVVSREQMMQHLWRSTHTGSGHTCEVHISKLRRKLERDPRHPLLIVTVRARGYLVSGA
jgi:DNA-binding response OmpR family regulator